MSQKQWTQETTKENITPLSTKFHNFTQCEMNKQKVSFFQFLFDLWRSRVPDSTPVITYKPDTVHDALRSATALQVTNPSANWTSLIAKQSKGRTRAEERVRRTSCNIFWLLTKSKCSICTNESDGGGGVLENEEKQQELNNPDHLGTVFTAQFLFFTAPLHHVWCIRTLEYT
jgi:hypothetical protein